MTLLDGILLGVMLISAVLAMIRGFTREVFSIAAWVAAAVATYMFWEDLLPHVQNYVSNENIALAVTVLGIFFVTLLVVTLITMKISDFILDSKAGPLDRTLGFVFGAARGLLLMVICVLFVNFFMEGDRQWSWISEAKSKPWLDDLGNRLLNMLPEDPEAAIMDLRPNEPEQGEPGEQGEPTEQGEQETEDGASLAPVDRSFTATNGIELHLLLPTVKA